MEHQIKIQNLKCGGCAHTIQTKLESIENISKVKINVEDSFVGFQYEFESDLLLVEDKLKQLGYPKDGEDNSGLSKAKSYVSCAIGKVSK